MYKKELYSRARYLASKHEYRLLEERNETAVEKVVRRQMEKLKQFIVKYESENEE